MGTQGGSQHSFTFDADTLLKDRADGSETTSAAETLILDFGGLAPGTGIEQVAYTKGEVVVDVDVIDSVTGDETVQLIVQLSDNVVFSSGNVAVRGIIHLGDVVGGGADVDDQFGVGRVILGVDNEFLGTRFRFMRLARLVGGTSPAITYNAFFARKQPA